MNTSVRSTFRTADVSIRAIIIMTIVIGLGFPAVVLGIAQVIAPQQANGSLLQSADGTTVGSSLIGQTFTDDDGLPRPEYFQPRASATDYDAGASSGSNLAQTSGDLTKLVDERRAAIAQRDNVDPSAVPADAVTASGSGLDPEISLTYAELQIDRVAAARGVDRDTVASMVSSHTSSAVSSALAGPTVNVVELNLALDAMVK